MKKQSQKGQPKHSGQTRQADRLVDHGMSLLRAGKKAEAIKTFQEAIAVDARDVNAWMNLALLSVGDGRQVDALHELRTAAKLAPMNAAVQVDICYGFCELRHWDEAISTGMVAATLEPTNARAYLLLGYAQIEAGQRDAAVPMLRKCIALNPFSMEAYIELHRALWNDSDLVLALEAITMTVGVNPGHPQARFYMGMTYALRGEKRLAQAQFDAIAPNVYRGAIDSWEYVQAHRSKDTRFLPTTHEMLVFAIKNASIQDGLVLELGVRYGASTRVLAQSITGAVHGFDSFEGLPEKWHIRELGAYSTQGQRPEVPSNVELHAGLFADTLPSFLSTHPGPIRLVNVDCDLYSSTKDALLLLADRFVPGSILIFDEYLINDAWRQDEYKAFQEIVAARGWAYEYLAFGLHTGQAIVRLLRTG